MRFEIRTGGAFLILVGLLGLSCVVFALGLVAGYEMARQNIPDTTQVATTFPAPSPAPIQASPAIAPAAAATAPAQVAAAPVSEPLPPPAKPSVAPVSVQTPAVREAAINRNVGPAVAPNAVPRLASTPRVAPPRAALSRAETAAATDRRHPYSIQIDAAMDRTGADDMVRRLRQLGFPSTETTTVLNGQTWYRVRVGPYATQEEAQEAQQRLHQEYDSTYNSR